MGKLYVSNNFLGKITGKKLSIDVEECHLPLFLEETTKTIKAEAENNPRQFSPRFVYR